MLWLLRARPVPALTADFTRKPVRLWLPPPNPPAFTMARTFNPARLWLPPPKPPAFTTVRTFKPARLWLPPPKPPAFTLARIFSPAFVIVFMVRLVLLCFSPGANSEIAAEVPRAKDDEAADFRT